MHQHPPTCAALGYFGVAWRKHVAFGKAQLLCRCVEDTFAALATNIITVEVGAEASGVPTTGANNPAAANDCYGRWWCRPLQVLKR